MKRFKVLCIIVFKGLELNPRDCWSTHAEAHVLEVEGRQDEGISFLSKTLNDWTVNKLVVLPVGLG